MQVYSAQILNVENSITIDIGDNNRNYKVKLACIDVDPLKEDMALSWLKDKLPRNKKVNLRPQGSDHGVLIARVSLVKDNFDLGEGLVENKLARSSC